MQISDHMFKYVWNVTSVISYFKPPFNHILEMQEMWVPSLGCEISLEEEMATHASILALEIPWTEEAGRHSSWGSKELDMTEHACHPRPPT